MVIFYSYVSLPEGRVCRLPILHDLKLGGHQPRTGVHHLVEMMGTANRVASTQKESISMDSL